MKRLRGALAVVLVAFLIIPSMAFAETRTPEEYMAEGIRAAYDNMHLVYQAYYDENGELEEQPGGYVAIYQEWDDEWDLISRTYLGSDGKPINRVDGFCKVDWSNGGLVFYDADGKSVPLERINLAREIKIDEDGWTDWMKPDYDKENSCFNIGYAVLGEKQVGDCYTCSFEIEFRDVTASQEGEDHKFRFYTQGTTDDEWGGANIWNSALINIYEPIENGTKTCVATVSLNEDGAKVSRFNLGFRCDYWASGEFRVKNVKVERGDTSTEWSPPM